MREHEYRSLPGYAHFAGRLGWGPATHAWWPGVLRRPRKDNASALSDKSQSMSSAGPPCGEVTDLRSEPVVPYCLVSGSSGYGGRCAPSPSWRRTSSGAQLAPETSLDFGSLPGAVNTHHPPPPSPPSWCAHGVMGGPEGCLAG